MPKFHLRPICRPIHTGFFQAPEYRQLPDNGHARLLLICLLVHPHGGTFHLPGLYNVGPESLREAASMPRRSFSIAVADLIAAGVAQHDPEYRLFWVPAALKLVGPPGNPNVVKGYARSLAQLPPSRLVDEAVRAYCLFLEPFGSAFVEPFRNSFETLSEGLTVLTGNPFGSPIAPADNIDSYIDKNKNLNRHSLELADCERILNFAAQSGWTGFDQRRVQQWLRDKPTLEWTDFLACAQKVVRREGIKDPFAYIKASLDCQAAERPTSDRDVAKEDRVRYPFEDGAELSLDA